MSQDGRDPRYRAFLGMRRHGASAAVLAATLAVTTLAGCGAPSTAAPGDGGSSSTSLPSNGSSSSRGGGCFTLVDGGTNVSCSFVAAAGGVNCDSVSQVGVCPSSGLVGCCVLTNDASAPDVGDCYYDVTAAAEFQKLCTAPGEIWTTSAP